MSGTEQRSTRANESEKKGRGRFFQVRVAILLSILFVVVLYAARDLRGRRERKDWNRTLDVAIVLLHVEGAPPVDPSAVQDVVDRAPALAERLHAEAERWRPGMSAPFRFRVFGPVDVASGPPKTDASGAIDLASHAIELRRWLSDVDPRAGVEPEHWDSRIYVDARRPASTMRTVVEGQSQLDGRIGVVSVELDASMVDLMLFVVTHELMHTLGALDKYDAAGRTRIPDGLVEPTLSPLYPQRLAEIMARNRVVSPSREVVPTTLDELGVGRATAVEIGWIAAATP